MKIAGKIIYILWSLTVAITMLFYCFSCYMGYKVDSIVQSAIESKGENFANYDTVIDEYNYIKLWHEKPDNSSFDRMNMEQYSYTQSYSTTKPYILAFKDKNGLFSLSKIGYIYDINIYDKDGNEIDSVATENSKVVLDVKYDGLDFKIESVFYDNDFNEYGVSRFHGIGLIVVLLVNAIARNIRYFDFCAKNRRKKSKFRLIQPYFSIVLIGISMAFDILALGLATTIVQEAIFTLIFLINKKKACS